MLPSVLVIAKAVLLRQAIGAILRNAGFIAIEVDSREQARWLLHDFTPDAVVFDADLNAQDDNADSSELNEILRFVPVCVHLRQQGSRISEHDQDKREGRHFVSKPFRAQVLVDAVAHALGVQLHSSTGNVRLGPLSINAEQLRATVIYDGAVRTLDLSPVQLRLLQFLVSAPDKIHTRDDLVSSVWPGERLDGRTVDQAVVRLRKELERFGSAAMLETVRGVGYRFVQAH